ncbi:putative ABC transporter permease [Treponema brennaborense]|uniref:ABC transporter permease n=1 Tax=Treponema brennaborense (strain DSM 12168 / CIP 105900 / DD5/3) TaxID=906968 RepID=F4LMR9_TREBD|nr:putative ABC transporter permease [Treponema brennaborense]AEE17809.1 protein of unknown function DUF1113 [Treponema brennaborense DSM 12168]
MFGLYQRFIVIVFLFFFGGTMGWVLELLFRRFVSKANPERKWLNPGFLTGPCLPLYGFGVAVLYVLSLFESQLLSVDNGGVLHYACMFAIMALAMTLIEYIAGILFVKGMHIKLWDYSGEWGNVQGVICPKFTVIWGVLSAVYYFFLFPPIQRLVIWFTAHPWFSFVVGIGFGLFIVDGAFSFHLGTVLRKKAAEIDRSVPIDFQTLQRKLKLAGRVRFFTVHNGDYLSERVDKFEEFIRRSPATAARQRTER